MPKDVILTPEGLQKLQSELDDLQTNKRREVAERIKEAREFGDISEDSEYEDAKNEQMMLEARIAELEQKLRSAQVIDSSELGTDVVRVGSTEANPAEAKLSNESPVGKALIGGKRGDVVSVQVPRGPARKLKITKIDV